ncbi:MAG TPA: hypothetical protein DCY07_07260 [Rhodospirillaceae bacterium]|nr:hypothetical protein [Rhodospirillaceae bacterium]
MHRTIQIFSLAATIALLSSPLMAASTGIQMLPPVQSGTATDPCKSLNILGESEGNKLLTWDGATSIKCNKNVVVDTSGNVGVGTTVPWGRLHVSGGRTFLQAANEPYGLGVSYNAGGGMVYFGAASGITTPDAIISNSYGSALARFANNGNVSIGSHTAAAKLDVAGAVKISADSAACSATNAGTIRWTGAVFQGCNGAEWKEFHTGPQYGGIYQTYLCAGGVYHNPDISVGGCRLGNPMTGACNCPAGFTRQRIEDFNIGSTCPQPYYEGKGMALWVCTKH